MPSPIGNLVTPVGIDVDGFPRAFSQLFGYSETLEVDLSGTAGGGTYTTVSGAVPAGELWIVQAGALCDTTGAYGPAYLYAVKSGGLTSHFAYQAALLANEPLMWTGPVVLAEGDTLCVYILGVAVGHAIEAGFVGYKMEL